MKMFFIPENWDQELVAGVWKKFFQILKLGYRRKNVVPLVFIYLRVSEIWNICTHGHL